MTDTQLLTAIIESPGVQPEASEAFQEMLDGLTSGKWHELTKKQREWASGVAERLGIDLGAANLVSSGAVKPTEAERASLGAFLSTLKRPMKPPGRSA